MLRITASLLLGVVVAAAVLGVGAVAAPLIESGQVAEFFVMALYLLAPLAASIFVKRRHPQARLLLMLTYSVAVFFVVSVGAFVIALRFGTIEF